MGDPGPPPPAVTELAVVAGEALDPALVPLELAAGVDAALVYLGSSPLIAKPPLRPQPIALRSRSARMSSAMRKTTM